VLTRYRRARAPSPLADEYLRAVRFQDRLRLSLAGFMTMAVMGTGAFGAWIDKEAISIRAGFFLLLASADVYYLRPDMIEVPAGGFSMGSADAVPREADEGRDSCPLMPQESPQHEVILAKAFRIGKHEVTFDEYDVFARLSDQVEIPSDSGWGRGTRPVIDVSWEDAMAYAEWLSKQTGERFRLPTESEWEYAARAGTTTRYWWGDDVEPGKANCWNCGYDGEGKEQSTGTMPAGSFPGNGFELHDTVGNVWEWAFDCWHGDYRGAPVDGSAWKESGCRRRVLRSGAWDRDNCDVRSATRHWAAPGSRSESIGFRLAQDI
jgi:formylglycine-generating enzyme required for sulfatase activity